MSIEISVRAGVCTGPGPCESDVMGEGRNWVTVTGEKTGLDGLPPYVRAIARALQRTQGLDEGAAIATALAAVKRWAAGGGKVSDATRARAAKAVAHWEALKAASHGSRSIAADNAAYREGVADRQANRPPQSFHLFKAKHPRADADDWPLYQAGYTADRDDLDFGGLQPNGDVLSDHDTTVVDRKARAAAARLADAMGLRQASGVAEWNSSGPPTPDASGSAALLPVGPSKKVADELDRSIEHHRFVGTDLAHCLVCGRSASAEVHRRPKAIEAGERHAGPGHAAVQSGHIKGDRTRRAKAAKAAHDRSAASLEQPLADALSRFFSDQRTSTLARLNGKRGKQMLKRAGVRAAQPPPGPPAGGSPGRGSPPPTGAKVTPSSAGATLGGGVTAAALSAGTVTVGMLSAALGVLPQEVANRLGYPRLDDLAAALGAGVVTMALLGAAFPDRVGPAAGADAPVEPSAIFDKGYWNDRLAGILQPYYDSAAAQAAANVRQHLEVPAGFDDGGSLAAAQALLEARGNQTSPKINDATYAEIVKQLQQGVAAGEGQQALAKRITTVFDQASDVRARRIAQTEVQSALNGSANAYAQSLPSSIVASKRWLAHWPPTGGSDPRTRDAHRLAAGQTVPIGSPFYVDGFPMQYPGDPVAPPDLIVNCRCALMFLPPGDDGGLLNFAAKDIHRKAAQAAGVTLSPAAESFVNG